MRVERKNAFHGKLMVSLLALDEASGVLVNGAGVLAICVEGQCHQLILRDPFSFRFVYKEHRENCPVVERDAGLVRERVVTYEG